MPNTPGLSEGAIKSLAKHELNNYIMAEIERYYNSKPYTIQIIDLALNEDEYREFLTRYTLLGLDIIATKTSSYFIAFNGDTAEIFGCYKRLSINTHELFFELLNVEYIYGLRNINTYQVTSLNSLFRHCRKLKETDIEDLDVSQVTDVSMMFSGCNSLEKVDVSTWKTNNLREIKAMFRDCKTLTQLDLHNFNASKISNMSILFSNCSNLKKLNIQGFKTGNVVTMDYTFYNCKSLTSLDLSGFNLENVQDTEDLFKGCNRLKNIYCNTCNNKITHEIIRACPHLESKISVTYIPVGKKKKRSIWSRLLE